MNVTTLPGLARDVARDVLVELHHVGHAHERLEAQVDLRLAGAADLVVVDLDLDAHALERERHPAAQVVQRVERGHGEVALLRAVAVAEVAGDGVAVAAEALARVPEALGRVDLVEAAVGLLAVGDVVEDVELGLGAEVGGVGDARSWPGGPRPCARRCAGRASSPRRVIGSRTSQISDSVGNSWNGSMTAVAGSGTSSMSDSLISWKPRIEEPSKPAPSVSRPSPSSRAATAKCCHVPGRSVNLRSTSPTRCSCAKATTSSGVGRCRTGAARGADPGSSPWAR